MRGKIFLLLVLMLSIILFSGCIKHEAAKQPSEAKVGEKLIPLEDIPEVPEEAPESGIEIPDFEEESQEEIGDLI